MSDGSSQKTERVVVFRGLRVRVGCASVSHELAVEVGANAAAGRVRYSGPCVAAAKHVQDAAQGGMVLASASTFAQVGGVRTLRCLVAASNDVLLLTITATRGLD